MQAMLDIVRQKPRTAYDVARIAFDFNVQSSLTIQFPATFETLAHLELLRARGQLECSERDGQEIYGAT